MRRRPVADRLAEKLVPDGSCTIRPIRTQSRLARPQNLRQADRGSEVVLRHALQRAPGIDDDSDELVERLCWLPLLRHGQSV